MNTHKLLTKGLALVCGLALMVGVAQKASAVGTASGTNVQNIAVVNYDVGGVAQTLIESSPIGNTTAGAGLGTTTDFVVDNMVDLTVTRVDTAAVQVTPGATDQVLTFDVTNTGNTTQDYALTALELVGGTGAFGGTDTFDVTSFSVFVESNPIPDGYDAADTATFIDELAQDTAARVYVVSSIPLSPVNNDVASFHLRATTHDAGGAASLGTQTSQTSGPETAGTVDVVFADAQGSDTTNDIARDGEHSSQDDYIIASAVLTVQKTSAVISDPFNGTSDPKRIPGATIRYTILVSNAGTATATADSVVITDTIPADLTYTGGTIILDTNTMSDAADTDAADYNVTNAGAVTVTIPSIAIGGSSTVTFDVTVN